MTRILTMLALLASAVSLAGTGAAQAIDYREDARTARRVSFQSPRAPLGACLQVLGEAAEVPLRCHPQLAPELLTGALAGSPLREAMDALATLFEAQWEGGSDGYILTPLPARPGRDAWVAETRKALEARVVDDQNTTDAQAYVLRLFNAATVEERERALRGLPVTFNVPEAKAGPILEFMAAGVERKPGPLTSPLIVTLDLDDRASMAVPTLRGRATALSRSSITGTLAFLDWVPRPPEPGAPPAEDPNDPVIPPGVGEMGQLRGTREEIILALSDASRASILSRHRAWGGTAGIEAGGRSMQRVMWDLANLCDAQARQTPRGIWIIASRTAAIDRAGLPEPAVVEAYLKSRPEMGRPVPFAALARLGDLTPFQISVLENSNLCTEDAGFARDAYGLFRFYNSLKPEQKQVLFGPDGVSVRELTHFQLHQILQEKSRRQDFDLYPHLDRLDGLSIRFREKLESFSGSLTMTALRGGVVVTEQTVDLPRVEPEERPRARRGR